MTDAVNQAAELLLAARRDPGRKLTDLPAELRPADRAAGYVIQARVSQSLGAHGGWKIGPFVEGTPVCGFMPASGVVSSPARVAAGPLATHGIEAEVGVRFGRDLPPRGTPYGREDIIGAIAEIFPTIEVLDSRYVESRAVALPSAIADTQSHGGLVYGTAIADWTRIDLAKESVEQHVDGALNASRTGHPVGDMIAQLLWLANVGSVWAGGLKAGQIVTTGSWTGANRVAANAKVRVKFTTLGEVALDFIG